MIRRSILGISLLLLSTQLPAQSTKARIVKSGTDDSSLRKRYLSLVCGVAFIQTERGSGTGFFINGKGDMVTAAHVVSQKQFSINAGGQIQVRTNPDTTIKVTPEGRAAVSVPSSQVEADADQSIEDLVYIHTGIAPPCWIPLGNAADVHIGDQLLSIGFPGADNGNAVLYDGFLSGRFMHPPIPLGQVGNQSIIPKYDVLKVQLPITAGASGSPVIDETGHAVGVVSEVPVIWTQDLVNITAVADQGSGITLSGFDTVKILGELARVVREFESPGSGYAVPTSNLKPMK